MLHSRRAQFGLGSAAIAAGLIAAAIAFAADPGEPAFMAENQAAMDQMMAGMAIKPSGDVDRDFAAMMIPHHKGAIDMAQAELRHGHNEQLRRIAQEIIVEQQQEIDAMHLALGQPLSRTAAAPDQPSDLLAGTSQPICRPQTTTQKDQ
jgi:hypothetical protein